MNTNSHTADALREILATCADPLNRACEEYAKLERELAEAQDIAAELITERARRSFEDRMSAASETRRTYEDGLEEAKNAVKRVTSAGRWDCGYEEPFDDAVQLCMSAIRAIKKSDPQGSDTNLETTASRVAPAASAPCVAGITGGEPEGGSSRPAKAGSTPAASLHISHGEQVPTQEQWKSWAEYACRRFKEETGKDLQAQAGT